MPKKSEAARLADKLREAASLIEKARAGNEQTKRLIVQTRWLIQDTKDILERKPAATKRSTVKGGQLSD